MKRTAVIFALIVGLAAPVGAWAQRADNEDNGKAPATRQETPPSARPATPQTAGAAAPAANVPLAQILTQISRSFPGRQLDAKPDQIGGVPVYRINWSTTDGRRIDFVYNAQTGRLISQQGG